MRNVPHLYSLRKSSIMKLLSRFSGVLTMSRFHWLAIPAVLATLVFSFTPSSASAQEDAVVSASASSNVEVTVRGMQEEPFKVRRDKAEIMHLDRPAANIILGDPNLVNMRIETPQMIVFMGAREGMTTLTILDAAGEIITERPLVVSNIDEDPSFVRVRRFCGNARGNCESEDVYFCEDGSACHTVLSEPLPVTVPNRTARSGTNTAGSGDDEGMYEENAEDEDMDAVNDDGGDIE